MCSQLKRLLLSFCWQGVAAKDIKTRSLEIKTLLLDTLGPHLAWARFKQKKMFLLGDQVAIHVILWAHPNLAKIMEKSNVFFKKLNPTNNRRND